MAAYRFANEHYTLMWRGMDIRVWYPSGLYCRTQISN